MVGGEDFVQQGLAGAEDGIVHAGLENRSEGNSEPATGIIWTAEQQEIFAEMLSDGNLCVNACAGSGKTTVALEGARRLQGRGERVLYLAFNKSVETEMRGKAVGVCDTFTYHALGMRAIRQIAGDVKVNEKRIWQVIEGLRAWTFPERPIKSAVKQLVGLAKQFGEESTDGLRALIDDFGIECGRADEGQVVFWAQKTMEACLRGMLKQVEAGQPVEIDFDDMVWLPQKLELEMPSGYDHVIVDECQDTNRVQQYIAQRVADRVTVVGDRWQSIYRFRGADVDSMERLSGSLNAKQLPLSYTRRCPKAVVALAQKLGVNIHALDEAPEGKVNVRAYGVDRQAQTGDMVLCRVNAPLIEKAYALISAGVPAHIKGREIGEGVVKLIQRTDEPTVPRMLKAAEQQTLRDVERYLLMPDDRGAGRAAAARDKLMCLIAASEGCGTPAEVEAKLNRMFDESQGGVVLGTVHKLKGAEADRVWILRPELMPHPMATKPEDVQQEHNGIYVAITRTKQELNFVGEMPECLN